MTTTNRFDYVQYDEKGTRTQADFKTAFRVIENLVTETLPVGRASSIVFTKLEEAYMWVGKAIRDAQVGDTSRTTNQQETRSAS